MSTPIITHAKRFIKPMSRNTWPVLFIALTASADWSVDFSRRTRETRSDDLRAPASVSSEIPIEVSPMPEVQRPEPTFIESLFDTNEIAQEIVVLNTERGFIPSTIPVKKGLNYQIHVVNVNEQNKNVSFVLDSFSQHHATYFGKIKTFIIRPQKEGVYRFVSPETSAQGKVVVYPDGGASRYPASE